MGAGKRLLIKQVLKYFLIFVVALFGVLLWRFIWDMPKNYQISAFIVTGLIILIAFIMDLLSSKDIIPILSK